MPLSLLSSVSNSSLMKSLKLINGTILNSKFQSPNVLENVSSSVYSNTIESTGSELPGWALLGQIYANNGQTIYSNNIIPLIYPQYITIETNATYTNSYVKQQITLSAGSCIFSFDSINVTLPLYEATSYLKITFGSIVILDNYLPSNNSEWIKKEFLFDVPTETTDFLKIEGIYDTSVMKFSITGLNITQLNITPVDGYVQNLDFSIPDRPEPSSTSIYSNPNTESINTILPGWYMKGNIYQGDSVNPNATEFFDFINYFTVPGTSNQYLSWITNGARPESYIRQSITLDVGEYLLSFYHVNDNSYLTTSELNFKIYFGATLLEDSNFNRDNGSWNYYSKRFTITTQTTADLKFVIARVENDNIFSLADAKLRRIS